MTTDPDVKLADLMTCAEVAQMCGVSRPAVTNWQTRDTHEFPEPVATMDQGRKPLFRRSDIIAWWAKRHPQLAMAIAEYVTSDAFS